MKIRTISETDSSTLMTWFSNQKQVTEWAGPNFSFPFTVQSFSKDLNNNGSHSFSLIAERLADSGELVGFGQCYLKSGKCHLARLVINPHMRGQGLATTLLSKLTEIGMTTLQVNQCSLFVWQDNLRAIRVYKKAGFVIQSAPQNITIENCLYMVKRFPD